MNRSERGTKRICKNCGTRFFDLGHQPIVCPRCQAIFEIPTPPPPSRFGGFAKVAPSSAAAAREETVEDLLEPEEEVIPPALDEENGENQDEEDLGEDAENLEYDQNPYEDE